MVNASSAPTEYVRFNPPETEVDDRIDVEHFPFVATNLTEGWHPVAYDVEGHQVDMEDEGDVQDSFEALKEPRGKSLEEFREELGA